MAATERSKFEASWPKVVDAMVKSWRKAVPDSVLKEAYPALFAKDAEGLSMSYGDFWASFAKVYKEEIADIFESAKISAHYEELDRIRASALADEGATGLESPAVDPESEMRTLAAEAKLATRDQLKTLVVELEARNDAVQGELELLDVRAKALLPRVGEKLHIFEKLRSECVTFSEEADV